MASTEIPIVKVRIKSQKHQPTHKPQTAAKLRVPTPNAAEKDYYDTCTAPIDSNAAKTALQKQSETVARNIMFLLNLLLFILLSNIF